MPSTDLGQSNAGGSAVPALLHQFQQRTEGRIARFGPVHRECSRHLLGDRIRGSLKKKIGQQHVSRPPHSHCFRYQCSASAFDRTVAATEGKTPCLRLAIFQLRLAAVPRR